MFKKVLPLAANAAYAATHQTEPGPRIDAARAASAAAGLACVERGRVTVAPHADSADCHKHLYLIRLFLDFNLTFSVCLNPGPTLTKGVEFESVREKSP